MKKLRGLPGILTLLIATGCASNASRQHAVELLVLKALPGQYDNLQQVHDDASGGQVALSLLVQPVQAPVLGTDVFYVRESSQQDARRVLAQRIWSFVQDKPGRVLQANYIFKEPQRWLNAVRQPELLQSIQPEQDLIYVSGCELVWTQTATGFEGVAPASCRPTGAAAGALVMQRLELEGNELRLTEQQVDADGTVRAQSSSAVEHFRRSSTR